VTSASMGTAEYSGPLTYHITITGALALSLPVGFTPDGRPVGIQIVAPPQCEHRLLSAAAAIEDALGIAERVPVEPRVVGAAAV
jgi:amidase